MGEAIKVTVRRASSGDAAEAALLLRRSIVELCAADHRGEPALVSGWIENKTEENVLRWIGDPAGAVFVAEVGGKLAGVGMVRTDGEVLLNYVHPEARFRGVSGALMDALEAEARAAGRGVCRLESTATARRFYERRGYVASGGCGSRCDGRLSCDWMEKRL